MEFFSEIGVIVVKIFGVCIIVVGSLLVASCSDGTGADSPSNLGDTDSSVPACTEDAVKGAIDLTFAVAKQLIGSRPWTCGDEDGGGQLSASRLPDASNTTEAWMKALSVDESIPDGFEVDESIRMYLAAGGTWYRVRYASLEETGFPLEVSRS